jgi:hypothetical protein
LHFVCLVIRHFPPALFLAALACSSPLDQREEGANPDASTLGALDADLSPDATLPEVAGLALEPNPSVQAEDSSTSFFPAGPNGHWWVIVGTGINRYIRADGADEACLPEQEPCDVLSEAPRQSYELRVLNPGGHYLWVRGLASDATKDSLHLGLDGMLVQPDWHFGTTDGLWEWKRSAVFDIAEAGIHNIDIYMREGGFQIDQIILTSDDAFAPTSSFTAPPLLWEAEDANTGIAEDSRWSRFSDADAYDGKAMRFGPESFVCECNFDDINANSRVDYGECTTCAVQAKAGRLEFNKTFENSNYEDADRLWLRARFQGDAIVHAGFETANGDGVLHLDQLLSGGTGAWQWYGVDIPAGPLGQSVHSTKFVLFGATPGLEVDRVIVTANDSFSPADIP